MKLFDRLSKAKQKRLLQEVQDVDVIQTLKDTEKFTSLSLYTALVINYLFMGDGSSLDYRDFKQLFNGN